ncbi:multicopper oxidase domain-containing protein [Auraticoccus sp. F435]|uniref:Multicopper oxidase domain-containing protein n=1 Tax=Auraticoccus cholistanensis TaxID=2656650 RepID=A0A6A9UVF7_9ACTN|nr:multicopper oxidase domain-containing protein [Auraticoccus cholistanensis]MVA76823.1 multicopper oxidase domain-containing protein [Auraticoccus cholistanensis]
MDQTRTTAGPRTSPAAAGPAHRTPARPGRTGRRVLAVVTAAALVAAALSGCSGAQEAPVVDTVGQVDFDNRLAVPPLDRGTLAPDGVREFDLVADEGTTEFRPGISTRTWGFDGSYLGPTLAATVGDRVRVRVDNQLATATTVHWHGMHLPAEMDGGPHQMIEPGRTWTPSWRVDQEPTTLWYHPHPHGETEEHVEMGLAGMFLLEPAEPDRSGLPHEYGVDDVPVVVQDKNFGPDGAISLDTRGFVGSLGDQVLVNGTHSPYLDVTTERVRLRLLNGSSARTYRFTFDDRRTFDLVGTDGGLLEAPHPTAQVQLSPGERAEIVVRLQPGERPVLRSEAPDLGMPAVLAEMNGGADRLDVLQLRAADRLAPSPRPARQLADIPRIDPGSASQRRRFDMDGLQINGRSMQMHTVDEVVEVDTVEIWEVRNQMQFAHSFHVHDVQFQVLDVDGQAPPPELAGWKDTIYTRPGVLYRIIMRFEDYTDPDTPYMYHCHFLAHEDAGMMGQFIVVEDASSAPDRLPESEHGGH